MNEEITARKLFEQALDWLKQNYGDYEFFTERDLVWTIQQRLRIMIAGKALPFKVYNDFPIVKARRRSLTADLAILNEYDRIEIAVEFKYEPDHRRGKGENKDIWPSKLSPSVVFWGKEGVAKDAERARQYVEQKKSKLAITVFVDEGGLFRHRKPYPGTRWIDWDCGGRNPRRASLLIGYFNTNQQEY